MSRKLKIAFDAKRLFHNREGLGSYARMLVNDLTYYYPENEYLLCTPSLSRNSYSQSFIDNPQYKIITAPYKMIGSWWRSKAMIRDLETYKVDVYFGLSNELPFGIANSRVKSVVMIHDMLYKEFPQQFSLIDRIIYDIKFKHAIQSADQILTTSKYTYQDIQKHFRLDHKEVQVCYQPVSNAFRQPMKELKVEDYYLVVGTINDRKDLKLVIEAYRLLANTDKKKVIVVGNDSRYKQKMLKLIDNYDLKEWFEFVSDISEEKLIELYSKAIALLFPSKYEGFGRPVLEALSLGTPVIYKENSSIPEVVGKYGIIIEYDSPESLAEAIVSMNQTEKRETLMNGVEEHLSKFDSANHSRLIMNVLSQVATPN